MLAVPDLDKKNKNESRYVGLCYRSIIHGV